MGDDRDEDVGIDMSVDRRYGNVACRSRYSFGGEDKSKTRRLENLEWRTWYRQLILAQPKTADRSTDEDQKHKQVAGMGGEICTEKMSSKKALKQPPLFVFVCWVV